MSVQIVRQSRAPFQIARNGASLQIVAGQPAIRADRFNHLAFAYWGAVFGSIANQADLMALIGVGTGGQLTYYVKPANIAVAGDDLTMTVPGLRPLSDDLPQYLDFDMPMNNAGSIRITVDGGAHFNTLKTPGNGNYAAAEGRMGIPYKVRLGLTYAKTIGSGSVF